LTNFFREARTKIVASGGESTERAQRKVRWAIDMRIDWREYNTGTGELLCFVLTWAVGAAIVWSDYAGQTQDASAEKVAVSSTAPASNADFD
jgi:hypothetical protein